MKGGSILHALLDYLKSKQTSMLFLLGFGKNGVSFEKYLFNPIIA